MSTTLILASQPVRPEVPLDEESVRSTVTINANDAPPSVADSMPDPNEILLDPVTEGGLTAHQVASFVLPSMQSRPVITNANEDLNARVNAGISTLGTAAAREQAGEWGHGTLQVVEGIEPTITDGTQFGADYFVVGERTEAATADYMTPVAQPDAQAVIQATGTANSRDAVQASQTGQSIYQTMLNGIAGGIR